MKEKKLRKRIRALELPDVKGKSMQDFIPAYERILVELKIKNKDDLDRARTIVAETIDELQTQIMTEACKGLMMGKYKDVTELPLYRNEENGTVENVPDSIMKWFAFVAWLNERSNEMLFEQDG